MIEETNPIFETYTQNPNTLPTINLYREFLSEAVQKLKISPNDVRNRYGLYTVKQWEELLK